MRVSLSHYSINYKEETQVDKDILQMLFSVYRDRFDELNDPTHAELGIFFHKGFTGKILQQDDPNALLRIDIVPTEVDICDLDKIDKLFGWPGNDCLSASVKSVLQDLKPIGKPIYSYFVRIQ